MVQFFTQSRPYNLCQNWMDLKLKSNQAQCNFAATKRISRGVETIRLESYLAWVPSTVCLKSLVTGLDDRITKGKPSANRFQAWQVDHERARRSFFKTNQDNEGKFRTDLGQNEDN